MRIFLTLALAYATIVATLPAAAQQKPKDLQWTHAFDLSCRPYGTQTFDKANKFGVEVFRDNNNNLGLYIAQTGSIGVGGGFEQLKLPLSSKGPDWVTGLDLPAREAGVKEFKKDTKVHAMEVFRDPNAGQWMYVTDKGNLGVAAAKGAALGTNKAPKWVHSVDLKVRKGGEREWKNALAYGIEVYRDGNTGNLVYICQTGSVAVIPESAETKSEAKAPEWLHGLDLACRKHNEPNFDGNTRKFGVEIFRDENNGNLIYVTETGSIAVTAGAKELKTPTPNVREPQWTHGLNVKCRAIGEKEFSEKTRTFGLEVFRDVNIAATIYVNELGNLAAYRK
jgi:hypothetical protein